MADVSRSERAPHDCPVCNASRALDAIKGSVQALEAAVDGFVEKGTDMEGSLYFLVDEVRSISGSPAAILVRKRLLAAIRMAMRP